MTDDFISRLHSMGFVVSDRSHNNANKQILKYIDIWKK